MGVNQAGIPKPTDQQNVVERIAWNWRVHGLPRCAAWFESEERDCRGLIWPWQRTGGNGEDVEHYACMIRERTASRGSADA